MPQRENPKPDMGNGNEFVNRLAIVAFLEWVGAAAILPLLPLFLSKHGASAGMVGVTMAAFFVASLCVQYPAGRLADQYGRRPVLIGGLILFAVSSALFMLPLDTVGFLVLRFIQGAAVGGSEVAALALVSSAVPEERRGRAMSRIYSAQFTGTSIGPVCGALVGVTHMGLLFTATAILCIIASVPVIKSSVIKDNDKHHLHEGPLPKISIDTAIIGALCIAIAFGLLIGVFESTWTLLMNSRHATELEIALTWTIFSLPYIVLVRIGGWLSDRADRRVMAIFGITVGLSFLALWPHISSILVILALCPVEPIGSSMMLPSVQGILTQDRTPAELGRIQGLYATANTAAIAMSASVSGWLYQLGHALPYSLAAGLGAGLVVGAAFSWRRTPGRSSASSTSLSDPPQ